MKLLLAAALAVGLASLPAQQVTACSCAAFGPKEAAAAADAVFAGTVVDGQPVGAETGPVGATAATEPAPAPFGQTIYAFEVDGVAKGDVGVEVAVLAGGDGASCGMSFGIGERWLVFTTWDGAIHSTGLCSGNVSLEPGGDVPLPLAAPTGGTAEAPPSQIPWTALALLGVVALVAIISWVAFRRDATVAAR